VAAGTIYPARSINESYATPSVVESEYKTCGEGLVIPWGFLFLAIGLILLAYALLGSLEASAAHHQ
jgi:hypothetical protein